MKMFFSVIAMIAVTCLLTSCSSTGQSSSRMAANFINKQNVVTTTKEPYPAKSPEVVAFYTSQRKPQRPYRIIGMATVSKYNLFGIQRQEATLQSMLQKLAASVGGDAVINLTHDDQSIQANIIAFEKILV
jgi:hypothetical protein